MKRSAFVLLTMMVMGTILFSCRSRDNCPAYNSSQVNPDVEEQTL